MCAMPGARTPIAALSAILLVSAADPVFAEAPTAVASQNRDTCSRGQPEAAIESCTQIINNKKEAAAIRAMAFQNRGSLLQAKGEFDQAIADYTAALELSQG